jgi:hypothetical protein
MKRIFCNCIILLLLISVSSQAQTMRKPNLYDYENNRVSEGKAIKHTRQKTKATFANKLENREQFDLYTRVFYEGQEYEIPHLLFVIDKKTDKIYYLNTPRFVYHEEFVRYLLKDYTLTHDELMKNYKDPGRRFMFGTISFVKDGQSYVYEFWEGDILTAGLLNIAQEKIADTFFTPVTFKTNSIQQEKVAQETSLSYITQAELIKNQTYIPLNKGKTTGRLRIIDSAEDVSDISDDDILVLRETPISLPPVSGIISEQASTILSHINILSRSWNIPNIYLKDSGRKLQEYDGQWVELKAGQLDYSIKLLASAPKSQKKKSKTIRQPDLIESKLLTLKNLRKYDSKYCGAKAANLGHIKAKIKSVTVPDGFAIPFSHYYNFITENELDGKLKELEADSLFIVNPQIRKQQLENLRNEIISWKVDEKTVDAWKNQWETQLGDKGVFVRSSSNSEDLPHFSGAGLYTTVPNVKNRDDLETAVKTVWASVFNFEAYEARRFAGIPHNGVMMSVFVQEAVNSDCSGVMITEDPFDSSRLGVTYISAKRGIGIKVVEGKRVAEQVMHYKHTNAIQKLSSSDEDTELRLKPGGGVEEISITGNREVLTDDKVLKLVEIAGKIKEIFGGKSQDIEWAIKDNQVVILQARPYSW